MATQGAKGDGECGLLDFLLHVKLLNSHVLGVQRTPGVHKGVPGHSRCSAGVNFHSATDFN